MRDGNEISGWVVRGFSALVMGALLGGCASASDDTAKRLGQIEKQLTAMQADHDRLVERLGAVEVGQDLTAAQEKSRPPMPAATRPMLQVVRMEPPGQAANAEGDVGATTGTPSSEGDEAGGRMKIEGSGASVRAVAGTVPAGRQPATGALN